MQLAERLYVCVPGLGTGSDPGQRGYHVPVLWHIEVPATSKRETGTCIVPIAYITSYVDSGRIGDRLGGYTFVPCGDAVRGSWGVGVRGAGDGRTRRWSGSRSRVTCRGGGVLRCQIRVRWWRMTRWCSGAALGYGAAWGGGHGRRCPGIGVEQDMVGRR